jgi:2-polyprenyl-3-methyl-5-hydroxy-6-metoxy-1,4-benzoquinol methylase
MKTRSAEPEKLDNLSLNGDPLHKALKSLEWINKWFGNHRSIVRSIQSICNKEKKPLTIIDLGCGGGDLLSAVARSLQKNKIKFSLTGIDGNDNTLQYAQKKCAGFKMIKFIQADILQDDFSTEPCDVLISSHFIYHFTEDGLIHFFSNNLPGITTAVVFSELERSRFAMILFKLSSFLLPISKLAKQDGLHAIKRSFTKKEWVTILKKANITSYRLRRVPLFRIQLVIFPGKKL